MADSAQCAEAVVEGCGKRIIGIVVKARIGPEAVEVRGQVRGLAAQPAKRRDMVIADAGGRQRGGKGIAVELRIVA